MRIKSRWNSKDKEHSVEESAGVMAGIAWRIAANTLLNLENEGFQTQTQLQRVEVIEEFVAFLLHVLDRLIYERMEQDSRTLFISSAARSAAGIVNDNRRDIQGSGDYSAAFVGLLNTRMQAYAEMSFNDGEPGFNMRCYLGDRMAEKMGPKYNRWIQDQILQIEAPDALVGLKRALNNVLGDADTRLA